MSSFETSDPVDLEGTEIQIHMKNGEVQFIMAGNDITDMISRASWYWTRGHLPRLSFDVSEISTLDTYSEVTTAKFRRKTT